MQGNWGLRLGGERWTQELHSPRHAKSIAGSLIRVWRCQNFSKPQEKVFCIHPRQNHNHLPRRVIRYIKEGVSSAARNADDLPGLGTEAIAINLKQMGAFHYTEDFSLVMTMQWRSEAGGVYRLDYCQRR